MAARPGTSRSEPTNGGGNYAIDEDLYVQLKTKYSRTKSLSNIDKRLVGTVFSPVKAYEDRAKHAAPDIGCMAATLPKSPSFSMSGRPTTSSSAPVLPSPQEYDALRGMNTLSRFSSAPACTMGKRTTIPKALPGGTPGPGEYKIPSEFDEGDAGFSMGVRLKSRREMDEALGVPTPPAPGGNCRIPSFAEESISSKRGVVFGSRLKDPEEILEAIGYPRTPAPGGNVQVPSFVREDMQQRKGVVFGHRFKTREELDAASGFPPTPAPGGNCAIPSFAEDSIRHNKGVRFGSRLSDPADVSDKLGRPRPPGPGAYTIASTIQVARGVPFGDRPPVTFTIDLKTYKLGPDSTLAPGGDIPRKTFADEGIEHNRGAHIGPKLKSREEIDMALGVGPSTTPAPGGNCAIPSFAEESKHAGRGVVFGHKLKTTEEILQAIGYPYPPAPGGNCQVPSFAEESKKQGRGVVFGHKLKSQQEILEAIGYPTPPAPGGNCKVPSFVEEDRQQNKGVVFGHRLPDRFEIEQRLGYPRPAAVGGTGDLAGFTTKSIKEKRVRHEA